MNKKILKQIRLLRVGDYVQVDWHDAYKGEIRIDQQNDSDTTRFEVPVTSWGVFIGAVGKGNKKYIILMRDRFNLNEISGIDDIDHNGIPVGMIDNIKVRAYMDLEKNFVGRLQRWLAKARVRKRKGRLIIPREENFH